MAYKITKPVIVPRNRTVANVITMSTACFATMLDILNLSSVNIAVPSISEELNLDGSTTPWLIASYAIAFAAFLMPAGKLGDLYGYRMVYLAGMIIFLVTSIINGVSPNEYVLFVFRAMQGLGAACTVPNAIALVANSYEDENSRRIALSIFGGSGPIGFVIGLILGGVLSSTIGWRWIFYISAMCSFVMFILAFLYVPDFRHEGSAEKVDVLGFLLVTSGFILIIYALSDGQWHLARDPVSLVIGVILIAAFLVWQLKSRFPLVRPSWWRRQNFAVAFSISFIHYAVFMGYIYVTTLMFQEAFHYTAIQTSLYYLPLGIVAFFSANGTGYLTPYTGVRNIMVIGSLLALAANVGSLYYSTYFGFWKLIFPMHILVGLGLPLLYIGGQNAMIASAPQSETGTLGAVYNTAGQLGSAVGLAIMTAVINGVNQNEAANSNGLPGYHAAFYVNIGLLGVSTIISIIFIKDDPKPVQNTEENVHSEVRSEETLQDLEKGKVEDVNTPTKEEGSSDSTSIVISP
ncbi:major facilitator superfamily domain-containing protein [Umbelopsis sp. PMI_123]|nr:major facilitator superfamily domain-containing protein [Umbelopsis sp. PMI_123]